MINRIKVTFYGAQSEKYSINFDEQCNQQIIKGYEFTRCWNCNGTEELKILDLATGLYESFTIISNNIPENIDKNLIFTNVNNGDQIEVDEINADISGIPYVWSIGQWKFVNSLKIVGIQHLPNAEFSQFAVINFPTDLQGFFMAVSSGSFKFERKDGTYILTLSN